MNPKAFTFIIKTFERPQCLERLVRSIRHYYPDTPIIVADDGKDRLAPEDPRYELLKLPFDVGLSAGRNVLLEHVRTPYFILLDDDFEFTRATRVQQLVEIAHRCGHDIVGGGVIEKGMLRHYEGQLERIGTTLHYRQGFLEEHGDHQTCEMVLNFFAGRTESVRAHGWTPELKLAEHTDFFWRAKGKLSVAYCPTVTVYHHRVREAYYLEYRNRASAMFGRFLLAHGFRKSINFAGTVFVAPRPSKVKRIKARRARKATA